MKKISVIIPAYNAGAFIENCINSILCQTYSNFEIIAVNDGSTDKTEKLLLDMQKMDSRLKVISQKNGGVSAARNTALANATGDFITCVDADDALPPNALKDMAELMTDDVDYVIASHYEVRFRAVPNIKKNAVFTADELKTDFRKYDPYIWFPWAKLYRRSIISENNLQYDTSITFGEDHIFNLKYSKHIKGKTVITDKLVYKYYYIRGGLCSKYYDNMHELQKYVLNGLIDFFGGKEFFPRDCAVFYTGAYMAGCIDYYIAWCSFSEARNKIKETLEVYSDMLDEEILGTFYSEKQLDYIKQGCISEFMKDYIIHNPKKTLFRKFKRTIRRILEAIQKIFK